MSALASHLAGGRALRSSPSTAFWSQDADGAWWYTLSANATQQRGRRKRFRGGFRTCAGCGGSFLAVLSRKTQFCGRACAVRPSNGRRGRLPGSTRLGSTGYVEERVGHDDPFHAMGRGVQGAYGRAAKNGLWILQHRLVMARALGRALRSDETVHHVNGDRTDNRLENLQLRVGAHGEGRVARCADCGSNHIVFEAIEDARKEIV